MPARRGDPGLSATEKGRTARRRGRIATGTTDYREIAARLRAARVSAFPVLDGDGRVAGVVSAADLLAKVSQADPGDRHPWFSGRHDHARRAKAEGAAAADLMTAPAITIGADELVSSAARVMSARRAPAIGHAIAERARHIEGVVTVHERPAGP